MPDLSIVGFTPASAPTVPPPAPESAPRSVFDLLDSTADRYGVPRELVRTVTGMESGFNPGAVSRTGAQGLMQLEPATARSLGVQDSFDPAQNVDGGVRYLRDLQQKYGGNTGLVLAAYNAGPGAVDKYGGVPPYPETQNYVNRGLAMLSGSPTRTPLTIAKFEPAAPAPATPQAPAPEFNPETERLSNIAAQASGLGLMSDISTLFRGSVDRLLGYRPLNDPQDRNELQAAGNIRGAAYGLAAEPARVWNELSQSGAALARGNTFEAVSHLGYAIPLLGGAAKTVQDYLDKGDVHGALAHAVGSAAPFVAGEMLRGGGAAEEAGGGGAAAPATPAPAEAAPAPAAAVPGPASSLLAGGLRGAREAVPAAAEAAAEKSVYGALGGPGAMIGAAKVAFAKEVGKGFIQGVRETLAARRAAAAAGEVVPESTVTAAAPVTPEVIPPERQLPPPPIVTPAPADMSFVRAVPAQYPEVEAGFQQPAPAQPTGPPPITLDDLSRSLAGKSFDRLNQAERDTVQTLHDRITAAQAAAAPVSPAAPVPQPAPAAPPEAAPPPETAPAPAAPQPPAPVTGVTAETPPAAAEAAFEAAKQYLYTTPEGIPVYKGAEAMPPEAAQMTPAEAESAFQQQKARIEQGMTPPETPPAAPGGGGVTLSPLPPDVPPHYGPLQQLEGTTAAVRAFQKDLRIGDYVLGKGISPDEFEAMTLDQQNQLIKQAPPASPKGRNLAFKPKPEGAAPRSVGRWAEEGIADIANTMRWRQAQTAPEAAPAAPEIPVTEGMRTPAEAEAAFEAQKAPEIAPPGGISGKLQDAADAALERMRQRGTFSGTKLSAGIPVDDLADMAIWGAAKLAKGTVDFAKWSKEILSEAGPAAAQIKPYLGDLYQRAQKVYQSHVERTDGNLASTRQLLTLYRAGEAGKDWYKYTQAELEQHFGEDAPLFVDMLAATSPNASVAANVSLALKAYGQYKTGQPFQGFMPAVIQNLEKVVKGESPSGPKVTSFKANLFGDPIPVTVDRWMARAMGWKTDNLTLGHYKFLDYMLTQIANKAGVEPRQMQAAIWKAIKERQGRAGDTALSFEQLLKRQLEAKPELAQTLRDLRAQAPPGPPPQ